MLLTPRHIPGFQLPSICKVKVRSKLFLHAILPQNRKAAKSGRFCRRFAVYEVLNPFTKYPPCAAARATLHPRSQGPIRLRVAPPRVLDFSCAREPVKGEPYKRGSIFGKSHHTCEQFGILSHLPKLLGALVALPFAEISHHSPSEHIVRVHDRARTVRKIRLDSKPEKRC